MKIASEKERDAYIAQACNSDAELRRQVEERVAAHFQADSQEKSPHPADAGTSSPEQAGADHAEEREPLRQWPRKHRRLVVAMAGALLLLLVAAVAGAGLAVWEWRKAGQAQKAEQEAIEKSKKAEKGEAEFKGKFHRSEAARKAAEKERDRAKVAEESTRHSVEETRAILDFIKKRLLSAGRSGDTALTESFWAGSQSEDVAGRKKVMLRQALDRAEAQVARAFAGQPLAEASVREMLGLAYLNLGEAAPAVKQYERALALREATQGVNHSDTADCRNKLAVAYRLAGRIDDASRLFDQNLNAPAHANALAVQGSILLSQKKPAEAELKLRACLTLRQNIQPDDWSTFDTKSMLGEALLGQKKYAEAEPLLLSGYEGMKQREDMIPSQEKHRLTRTLERLVHLYEAWGKQDKATKWRRELEAAKRS